MKNSQSINSSVKKAVIPAAGLGTRLGALSAITPKELLPLVNKPSLHWILDEAEASGIEEVCLIISPVKNDLMQQFLANYSSNLKIDIIMQRRAGGLGHAILAAERWIGSGAFAVILPDDFLLGEDSLGKLINAYKRTGLTTLALAASPQVELSFYGVANTKKREDELLRVIDIVEKPPLGSAPSNLTVVGRYILTDDIWRVLHEEALSAKGEIQLTSAIQALAQEARVVAIETTGIRHDIGNQTGWLKANIEFANWIEDGSSVLESPASKIFSDFLVSNMSISQEVITPEFSVDRALEVKKIIESMQALITEPTLPALTITNKMWDKAFLDVIQINKIRGLKSKTAMESLPTQWNRFKENPTASSPYVILFEDETGYVVVDGHQRIHEFIVMGIQEIPAWTIRPLDFKKASSRD